MTFILTTMLCQKCRMKIANKFRLVDKPCWYLEKTHNDCYIFRRINVQHSISYKNWEMNTAPVLYVSIILLKNIIVIVGKMKANACLSILAIWTWNICSSESNTIQLGTNIFGNIFLTDTVSYINAKWQGFQWCWLLFDVNYSFQIMQFSWWWYWGSESYYVILLEMWHT